MKYNSISVRVGLDKILHYLFVTLLLAFCSTGSMAAEWNLGPLSISGSDLVQIHFLNRNPTSSKGVIPIAVRFLDSTGKTVAIGAGDCGVDVCLPGTPLLVDSRHITTVSLAGSSLKLAPNESMLIQPIVTVSGPANAFLKFVYEQHSRSPARGVIQYLYDIPGQLHSQSWSLGPVTLNRGELAQFSITYCGPGNTALQMFFGNFNSDFNHVTQVTLANSQAASIELDGDATDIAGVPGVIFGEVQALALIASGTLNNLGGTLAIIDKATGAKKALLSLWGCGGTSRGGFTSIGDGGGGA